MNIAFIRGRKIGGTAIHAFLRRSSLREHSAVSQNEYDGHDVNFPNYDVVIHVPQINKRVAEVLANRTKFAVVRNPYSKVRSGYWWCRDRGIAHFLENSMEDCLSRRPSFPCHKHEIFSDEHFYMTQAEWLSIDGKLVPDRIIRFENLEEEFREFMQSQGYEGEVSLPIELRNGNDYVAPPLTESEQMLIREKYHDDFINFGYSK